jgi:CheY-like chemotaxis protein
MDTTTPAARTVLLVEDEEAVRRLASLVLRSAGFAVLEAADALEAALIAETHRGAIALLLCAVSLPGVGGLYLARSLAAARPGLKVLLTSGHEVGAADGMGFLRKPFTGPALLAKVREALGE